MKINPKEITLIIEILLSMVIFLIIVVVVDYLIPPIELSLL